MNISDAIDVIVRGETTEQYKKRILRLKQLANERDDLRDAIEVLGDDPRSIKKRRRLAKVLEEIGNLR